VTIEAKFWVEVSIVSADVKVPPIVNECVGVQSLEDAFDEAEEILRTAREMERGR
jgi:hypothetical protein